MPHVFLCATRPLIIITHTINTQVVESGWRACDLLDESCEPLTGAYDPEPKGESKDDPEATGVYLGDWELTELSSGRQNMMKAIQTRRRLQLGTRTC